MIDQFGQVMVYVHNPRQAADFWVEKLDFIETDVTMLEDAILAVEVTHSKTSDVSLMLLNRAIVEKLSQEVPLSTPSILFSSYHLQAMYDELKSKGVEVGEMVEMPHQKTFNFADVEGNYFAVREIKG